MTPLFPVEKFAQPSKKFAQPSKNLSLLQVNDRILECNLSSLRKIQIFNQKSKDKLIPIRVLLEF